MNTPHSKLTAACLAAILLAAPAAATERVPKRVGFNQHIRPLLVKHCVACHGGPKQASGLSLLRRESALSEDDTDTGLAAIVPGKPDESYLIERIAEPEDDLRMPPPEHGPRLTDHEVALVRRWIESGAEWQEHWSLEAPAKSRPPNLETETGEWGNGMLDSLILKRLADEGLQPSKEASRSAWLRRVSFDLTGLPPTESDFATFLGDRQQGAHARVVDRLLASPHYGERWASVWLDLARYADTKGYEKDPHRDIWPYRDWLIRAFNADMPYDEFTIKQLAGDLLPNATLDDRLATAFHRNTPTNTEGGTDDEEYRTAAVVDRVNTTWQVWQGTTFGCAQCHDHPYDAFTIDEYYNYLAFFNSTRDADLVSDEPNLPTPLNHNDYARANQIDREIKRLTREWHAPLNNLAAKADQWTPLQIEHAESTGSTKLRFDKSKSELLAEGTLTNKSQYETTGPLPELDRPITALRIDVLPENPAEAIKTPELGFALTRLRLFVSPPASDSADVETPSEIEVTFSDAVSDEPLPTFDAAETLRDTPRGWAVFSRMWAPRRLVLVLDEPLVFSAGARFRMEWKHERKIAGQGAMIIRRSRVSVSTNPGWQETAHSGDAIATLDRVDELKQERKRIKNVRVPILAEREQGFGRSTYQFIRGSWLAKGEEARPGTPASMPSLPVAEEGKEPTRLDLARWIASPDNPLTSRTMVNRVWAELFGTGLVETLGDLGASGESPSHSALLDHLAVRFQADHGWRVKALLREIVLSATYRQDASVSAELAARDPRNRLLARGPRQRLTAEMVRDQALVLSGRFSPELYGRPVMPYQPDGVWRSAYSGAKWTRSKGKARYRRAIYTYWKRTSGYPSLLAFDTPSREVCSARRVVTNTPLQALVTMNDPAYVELAGAFGDRMQQQAPDDPRAQVAWAYEAAAGRPPSSTVVDELLAVYHAAWQQHLSNLKNKIEQGGGVAGKETETSNKPQRLSENEVALEITSNRPPSEAEDGEAKRFARSVVASVILNLDEVLTR